MTTPDPTLLAQLHRIRLSSTTSPTDRPDIPRELVTELLALSKRSPQPVKATLRRIAAAHRTDAGGEITLQASHVLSYALNGGERTTERYLRLVRAAKIVTAEGRPKVLRLSHTAGGYVSYVDVVREMWPGHADRVTLIRKINQLFETAKWSFDGPRDEFRSGELSVTDRPGVRPFGMDVYPVLQRFDFLGVLYNPPGSAAPGILNVNYYQDSFIALTRDSPVEPLKPLPV